jgi:hypothetical protein
MEALFCEQTAATLYVEKLTARGTAGKTDHEGGDGPCANPGQATGQDYPLRQAHEEKNYHHGEIRDQYPDQPSVQGADSREIGCRSILFPNLRHRANLTGGWRPQALRGQLSQH